MPDRDDIGVPIWPDEAREPEPQPVPPCARPFVSSIWLHRCIAKNELNVFLPRGKGCRACGARERR